MTPEEEQISKIEEELDGARRDLHETLSAVNAKMGREVERVEGNFSLNPTEVLRNNLIGAACVAGLLGFVVGSSKYRKLAGPMMLAAVGYGVWTGLTNERKDKGDDGGQSSSS
jgi:hypothetical protein